MSQPVEDAREYVDPAELTPHPQNYRVHPPDEIDELAASIEQHGFYKNVVVARDYTILAGHGTVQAALALGLDRIPVVRLDYAPDDAAALKVLVADNEIARLAETDERKRLELLNAVVEAAEGLQGTGWSEEMRAVYEMVVQTDRVLRAVDYAAEWEGMPLYERVGRKIQVVARFATMAARDEFLKKIGIVSIHRKFGDRVWAAYWPDMPKQDLGSIRYWPAEDSVGG